MTAAELLARLPDRPTAQPGQLATADARLRHARDRAERDALRAVVTDWLKFAKDVQPGCAAGADWLEGLRKRSDAALAARGKE